MKPLDIPTFAPRLKALSREHTPCLSGSVRSPVTLDFASVPRSLNPYSLQLLRNRHCYLPVAESRQMAIVRNKTLLLFFGRKRF